MGGVDSTERTMLSDVWSTGDGTNWEQVTVSASSSEAIARVNAGVVVTSDSTVVVAGGRSANGSFFDEWTSSTNGVSDWTKTESSAFGTSSLIGHSIVKMATAFLTVGGVEFVDSVARPTTSSYVSLNNGKDWQAVSGIQFPCRLYTAAAGDGKMHALAAGGVLPIEFYNRGSGRTTSTESYK